MKSDRNETLLYLVYGDNRDYQLELSYSVLSAAKMRAPGSLLRIVLATDARGRRDDLPLEHLIFTPEQFAAWTDKGSYRHGAKVGALGAALDHCGGKVALVDTDTYFLSAPEGLFDRIGHGNVLMHAHEGMLAARGSEWDPIVTAFGRGVGTIGPIGRQSRMFNSGVVGVTTDERGLVDEVASLALQLHRLAPAVHDVEQFAFAHVLGANRQIQTCSDILRHYWGYERRFIHTRIAAMFPDFTPEAFAAAAVSPDRIDGFPAKPKFDLLVSKWKRLRRRTGSTYAFAYLAYRCAFNARTVAEADAWAETAIDAIGGNNFAPDHVAADFHRMRPQLTASYAWLSHRTRRRWNAYWQGQSGRNPDAATTKPPVVR